MFDSLVVVARELAEILLICGTLWASLARSGQTGLRRYVVIGVSAGALAGCAIALAVLSEPAPNWPSTLASLVFAAIVLYCATRALTSASGISRASDSFVEQWSGAWTAPAVGLLSALVAMREFAEITVFLRSFGPWYGWGETMAGALLGVLAIGLLAGVWSMPALRARLSMLFRLSALLLALLAIELLLSAMGSLFALLHERHGYEAPSSWAAPFMRGGAWHGWTCAALMVYPTLRVVRDWWRESALRAVSR